MVHKVCIGTTFLIEIQLKAMARIRETADFPSGYEIRVLEVERLNDHYLISLFERLGVKGGDRT